jgi:hypothetical protein
MTTKTPVHQRLITGIGGALLIASLFLPWANAHGVQQNAWEFNSVAALYFLIGGTFGIVTAITGGLYGLCRPDVSVIGATDLLNTAGMLLFAWLIYDYPAHTTRQPGVFCALASAVVTALAIADYRPLRGAPWFSPTNGAEPANATIAR